MQTLYWIWGLIGMTEDESALGTAVSCTGLMVSYCYASRLYNLKAVGILTTHHIFKTLPVTQTVTNNITTHE